MAKTPKAPPEAKKPVSSPRSIAAAASKKVIVSKQVFTDFAAI